MNKPIIETKKQQLYRHFDSEDNLLYVGVSMSAAYRLSQHKVHAHWFNDIAKVEIEHFNSRDEVLKAEKEAIQNEQPKCNIQYKYSKTKVKDLQLTDDVIENTKIIHDYRIVSFKPFYKPDEVAEYLDIPKMQVKVLIEKGKIGSILVGTRRNSKYGERPIYKVSGWQLIEFVESMHNGEIDLNSMFYSTEQGEIKCPH